MGPINEWWTAGFDGGENALIGFSTGITNPGIFLNNFSKSVISIIFSRKPWQSETTFLLVIPVQIMRYDVWNAML